MDLDYGTEQSNLTVTLIQVLSSDAELLACSELRLPAYVHWEYARLSLLCKLLRQPTMCLMTRP